MAPAKVRRRDPSSTGLSRGPKNSAARVSTSSGGTDVRWKYLMRAASCLLLVVLDAEVGDLFFAHQPAQRVLELGLLDEEVVLGIEPRGRLRALEVEREPLLDAGEARTLRQVEEEREVEHERRGQ